jgi:ABC-type Mn2+/Zn2+ transport system ATPase subunit
MLGLVEPSYGRVRRRVPLRFGYVPQAGVDGRGVAATISEVVAMSLPGPRLRSNADRRTAVADALDRVGLSALGDRPLDAVSGGERRLALLARALVAAPDVLVLDEPAAGVDLATAARLLDLLAGLHAGGQTIVHTTHDLNAAALLPRLVCLNRTVVADGRPSEVLHPYVLERTFGAPMRVLAHDGLPVVLERPVGIDRSGGGA